MLEVAAASNNSKPERQQSKIIASAATWAQNGLLSAPVDDLMAQSALPPTSRKSAAEAVAAEKSPDMDAYKKTGADYLTPATVPVTMAGTKSAAPNEASQQRVDPYDRSRRVAPAGSGRGGGRGGSGGRGGGAGAVESKSTSECPDGDDAADSDSDSRSGGGGGSGSGSDSEEDWRAMRNRQKKSSDRKSGSVPSLAASVTRSSSSPATAKGAPSSAQQSRGPAAGGFWGAYGAPTQASAVTSSADREDAAAERVGDAEDPRYNAFVAEYAAAHNIQLADDEDSESEGSDSEKALPAVAIAPLSSERGLGQEVAVVELQGDATDSKSEPASSERIEPTPSSPVTSSEPALLPPMPPHPAPPAASLPAVSPPKAPLPLPLLVSVPLSAQLPPAPVQALSGSLGSAAAGRRPRGKTGSIMSAAGKAVRKPAEVANEEPSANATVGATVELSSSAAVLPISSEVADSAPPSASSAAIEPAPDVAVAQVDTTVWAAEETARIAALRAAAIHRAVSLDLLHAPVLSPLPCAYVSNKSSGTTVEFPAGSLPAKLTNHGVSVDRLVLVDVDLPRLQAVCGAGYSDHTWVSVVGWVLQALGDKYGLLALQHGLVQINSAAQFACRLVLETTSEKFSASELLESAKSTPLQSVFKSSSNSNEGATGEGGGEDHHALSVADAVNIRDSFAAPLMADLEFFSLPLSDKAHIPCFESAVSSESDDGGGTAAAATGMVTVRDVAVCALKSHVLGNQHFSAQAEGVSIATVLTELVSQAERAGLCLCGMRLVHLNALELFEYESFCSIPGYSRPVPPLNTAQTSGNTYNPHVLPVLCLAFHSSNIHAGSSGFSATSNKTGTTSMTNAAATALRAILGPDDPALAVKTDPRSLRAQFGSSKEHNLAYPIPHAADRLYKETSFWFGGRTSADSVSKKVALLAVSPPRRARIGVTLQISRSALNANSAARLSFLQATVLTTISESMGAVGHLRSLSSFTSSAMYRVAIKGSGAPAIRKLEEPRTEATSSVGGGGGGNGGDGDGVTAQYFVWEFASHVGDLFLEQCVANLSVRTGKSTSSGAVSDESWSLTAEWSVAQTKTETESASESDNTIACQQADALSGSKLLALDMLKRVSEDDCKSHEDVGLPDVVVLSIGDESTATYDAATEPVLPMLICVLSMLPRTCEATLLAVKCKQRGGSGLLALLRGYQILENIDYAISETQRIMSGGGSPTGRPSQQRAATAFTTAAVTNKGKGTEGGVVETENNALCYSVKPFKGKRALELIFTEFPLSSVLVDLALRDLHTYVPLPGLQRSGFSWLEQVSLNAAQCPAQGNIAAPAATGGGCGGSNALISAPAQYLQALFPPGVFTGMGAVLVPWLTDGASFTRNLARIVSRLEKEHFEILEMKAVSTVSEGLIRQLYAENLTEYALNVRGGSSFVAQSAVKCDHSCNAAVEALKDRSFFVILVRRRSALLQLKSVVGPVCSAELAEALYPRSLVILLASLTTSSSSSSGAFSAAKGGVIAAAAAIAVPLILPTLSCATALCALEELFPHFYASYEAQQTAVSLNLLSTSSSLSGAHCGQSTVDSANIEHLTEVTVGTGKVSGQVLRVPLADRINPSVTVTTAAVGGGGEIVLRSDLPKASGGGEMDALKKQVDIAGIVISHALLREVGLGVILESLHREGLMVSYLLVQFWIYIVTLL